MLEKSVSITKQEKGKIDKYAAKAQRLKHIIVNYYHKISTIPLLAKSFLNEISLISTSLYNKLNSNQIISNYTSLNNRATTDSLYPSDASALLKETYSELIAKAQTTVKQNNPNSAIMVSHFTQTQSTLSTEAQSTKNDKLYVKVFELESTNRIMKCEIGNINSKVKDVFEHIKECLNKSNAFHNKIDEIKATHSEELLMQQLNDVYMQSAQSTN